MATAVLIETARVSAESFLCAFDAGPAFPDALPGQFVHVRTPADVTLRRPFSVAAVTGPGLFELLVRKRGKGTDALLSLPAGAPVPVIGPGGNAFTMPGPDETAVLVAGGIGVAGLRLLARTLATGGARLVVLVGARTGESLLDGALPRPTPDGRVRVEVATDDGTRGFRGIVSALLERTLPEVVRPARVYCCGPAPMLRAASSSALAAGHACEVLVEEIMACGVGACRGCVVSTRRGYRAACTDGPVFDAADVVFDGGNERG
jgi:dihydroorotate dehydrogenase electron transfer subunit